METRKIIRRYLSLLIMISCVFLGGCHQKSSVFEKESIRFFPSSLYFQGNQALFEDVLETAQIKDDSINLKVMIQFLAESEKDVEHFYDEVESITIVGNHGNNVKGSINKGDISQIIVENVKDRYHLDGHVSGNFYIVFEVKEDFKANEILVKKKDGNTFTLDCIIDVQCDKLDSKKKSEFLTYYGSRNDRFGELYNEGQDLSILEDSNIKIGQVHYNKDVLNATLDVSENGNRLIIESKDPWRTINYYMYIEHENTLIPVYGELYFEYFYSIIDRLL